MPVLVQRPELLPLAAGGLAWLLIVGGLAGHGAAAGHLAHGRSILVMVVATMGLYAIPLVRMAAFTTQWWDAPRAVAIAFGAFLGTWFTAALGLHPIAELLAASFSSLDVAALLLAAYALSALSSRRARLLLTCCRLVRTGRDSIESVERRSARFGAVAALRCAQLCLLPMLAMLLVPVFWVMAALTALGLAERFGAPGGRVRIALAYGALSLAFLM
jgi:hypothetical protein